MLNVFGVNVFISILYRTMSDIVKRKPPEGGLWSLVLGDLIK